MIKTFLIHSTEKVYSEKFSFYNINIILLSILMSHRQGVHPVCHILRESLIKSNNIIQLMRECQFSPLRQAFSSFSGILNANQKEFQGTYFGTIKITNLLHFYH